MAEGRRFEKCPRHSGEVQAGIEAIVIGACLIIYVGGRQLQLATLHCIFVGEICIRCKTMLYSVREIRLF